MTRKEQIEQAVQEAFLKSGIDKESFRQGIEWADEHLNDEVLKLRKMFESDPDAYKQGYKDAIDKVCEFMQSCEGYVVSGEKCNYENFIKYMEEQQ